MKIGVWISIIILFGLLIAGYWDLNKKMEKSPAVINMEKLYHAFDMTKDFEKKYVRLTKERGQTIDSLNTMLRQMQTEEKAVAVNQKIQTVAYAQANLQQENERTRMELEQQIWNQLNQYLYQFGEAQEHSIILGAQGNGNVIYMENPVDITDAAIEFVNLKYRGIN